MVTRLVPTAGPLPRQWLVFFRDGDAVHWWARPLRPGFRHVCAAAWYESAQRWVFFNPVGKGLQVEIETDEVFGHRFAELLEGSTVVLRTHSRFGRRAMPAAAFCVGSVKALLGFRGRALFPAGLYRDLVADGAEIVWRRPHEAACGILRTGPGTDHHPAVG
jgi:hypothetical protein